MNFKQNKNLVWLASYPKSGNTWVRAAISLAVKGNLDLNNLGINSFANCILPNISKMVKLQKPGDVKDFWNISQENLSKRLKNHNSMFLKTHNVCGKIGDISFPLKQYTRAVIYIIRDPRDVAISYSHHFGVSIETAIKNLMDVGNFIFNKERLDKSEIISSWNNHVRSWLTSDLNVLLIKYEDLLKEPEKNFEKIFNFLKIKPILKLSEIVKVVNFNSLSVNENELGFLEKSKKSVSFFRKGTSQQWQSYDPILFKELIQTFRETMKIYKYLD